MTQNGSAEETAIAEVIAAEQRRCQAMADDDVAAVEGLLGDELWYLHANGHHDDKSSIMASFKDATRSVERDPLDVRIYGDVAVVIGGYVVTVAPRDGSSPRRIDNNGLQVWVKRDGRWQLVAHQGAAR